MYRLITMDASLVFFLCRGTVSVRKDPARMSFHSENLREKHASDEQEIKNALNSL